MQLVLASKLSMDDGVVDDDDVDDVIDDDADALGNGNEGKDGNVGNGTGCHGKDKYHMYR